MHFFFFFFVIVKLSLGAVQTQGLQKPVLPSRNFHGCLENLIYNDLNLIDLVQKKNHQVSVMVSADALASVERCHDSGVAESTVQTDIHFRQADLNPVIRL